MRLNELSVEEIVEYINSQLELGRSMKDIEINDFKINDRVMVKRLNRKGYKRVENRFIDNITKDIQMDRKEILINKKSENLNKKIDVIQWYNKDINPDKILELVELLEPIKNLIEDYERNKNIIEVENIELKPKAITKVKQKLFKIDVDVLEKWEEFVINHKEFKVQQLISMALEEFIEKYKLH